jgi:hypothetical protein
MKQARQRILQSRKTAIEGNKPASDILTIRAKGAKNHFAGERGQAARPVSIRSILQLSKLVIRHPEVYKATSNLLHGMSSSFALSGGVGCRREVERQRLSRDRGQASPFRSQSPANSLHSGQGRFSDRIWQGSATVVHKNRSLAAIQDKQSLETLAALPIKQT